MKIYFQLRIPKYLEATYAINKVHIIKKQRNKQIETFLMAFRDLVAYLVIKIWIKSKLPKIALEPKIGLVKLKTQNTLLPPN